MMNITYVFSTVLFLTPLVIKACANNEFQCNNKNCTITALRCDGTDDCGDLSDELNCSLSTCPEGLYSCDGKCVRHVSQCSFPPVTTTKVPSTKKSADRKKDLLWLLLLLLIPIIVGIVYTIWKKLTDRNQARS